MECFKLVHSMLENNDERTQKMLQEFNTTLNLDKLRKLMVFYHSEHEKVCWNFFRLFCLPLITFPQGVDNSGELNTKEIAISIFHIFKRMQDLSSFQKGLKATPDIDYLHDSSTDPETDKVLKKLESESASIEFIRDGQIQRIHFYQQFVFAVFKVLLGLCLRLRLPGVAAGAHRCVMTLKSHCSGELRALLRQIRSAILRNDARSSLRTCIISTKSIHFSFRGT
jgi:hypothetical protein